ncbi:MAG: glutamine synthetase family protein [Nanoarchaeota archaeon]
MQSLIETMKFVELQFTDFFGRIKSVSIPVEQAERAFQNGVWFDGSSIEGFARIHESDMYLVPEKETLAELPWTSPERRVGRVFCDVFTPDGNPFAGDPRFILKKMLQEAKKQGFIFNTGPELEFFLFQRDGIHSPVPNDVGGYFDYSPKDIANTVRKDAVMALQGLGLDVEAEHHEVAHGQHEIDFKYDSALRTADNAITFKYCIKSISQQHGLYASFMPKPVFGQNGSGMHVHQSIFDSRGNNLFFDEHDRYRLSPMAYHFIAGQMAFIKDMIAILCPTVNSYKRLLPGYEAACYICWAQVNRSALIRIPRIFPGRTHAARAELRCPDPSCNPYLAFAVMLKAGLEGIRQGLEPPEPVNEDVYRFTAEELEARGIDTLPASLYDAVMAFKKSKLMKDLFGEETHDKYVQAKLAEWDDYRMQVTDWERARYFENV